MRKRETTAQREMKKAQDQLDAFDDNVKSLTMDRLNEAPLEEKEPQLKLSSREIAKKPDVYLKPYRAIGSQEKFNEKYRKKYNFAKEYVHFTAENNEVIGETIDMWTKPFAGMPAEWWKVPTNKPVWAPRYVAEQISNCKYHRLRTEDTPTTAEENGVTQYGTIVVDKTINRLDARPVSANKSLFMGATSF